LKKQKQQIKNFQLEKKHNNFIHISFNGTKKKQGHLTIGTKTKKIFDHLINQFSLKFKL